MTKNDHKAHFLTQPLDSLSGIGERTLEKFAQCGVSTIGDLLFHLPLRYQDRTTLVNIGDLQPFSEALFEGEIIQSTIQYGRRRSLLLTLSDGSGTVRCRFFYFSTSQINQLKAGVNLRCYGEVRLLGKQLEVIHPEYQRVQAEYRPAVDQCLTPVYPTTEGLSQKKWLQCFQQVISILKKSPVVVEPLLPQESESQTISLLDALLTVHQPAKGQSSASLKDKSHPAYQRLILEELVAHQCCLRQQRQQFIQQQAPVLKSSGKLLTPWQKNLPFKLTSAQQRVAHEICEDIARPQPMLRLVQGDVGSGKTAVAMVALLIAVENQYQAALMAPTEILAEQHAFNLAAWAEPLGLSVVLLSGKLTQKKKRDVLERITLGMADIVVGTHALIEESVEFKRCGLIVIDEQHRFGVHQRMRLKQKGDAYAVHQLVMTATPIPRTLAMTAYADLAVSIIDELPPGRKPITTVVLPLSKKEAVIDRIKAVCQQGAQVYWVCTLIESSDEISSQAAEESFELLQQLCPELNVGLVHGRLKSDEKEYIMAEFKAGKIQCLVATTVIEVGVDVPNASLMVIENPERLGLAQLHQLRGRIGRGSRESHCVLLYDSPLSESARSRLEVMRRYQDGFKISECDLKLRGPGEVLGTRQTGVVSFRIADLLRDEALIAKARKIADNIVVNYPEKIKPLIRRWIGQAQQYAEV